MLERVEAPDGSVGYLSPSLREEGVPHLFTTAVGLHGTPFDAGSLEETGHGLLSRRCGVSESRVVRVQQVHGNALVCAEKRWEADEPPPADALWSEDPDSLLLIQTADCLPVLLAGPDGTRVAAVHAGWRGLVAGILPLMVAALETNELVAALGPCISRDRFEVGTEVARAFQDIGLEAAVHPAPRGSSKSRPHIDLKQAASLQLEAAGVRAIDTNELCTWNDGEFHSFRRDVTHGGARTTGRMAALIAPRA